MMHSGQRMERLATEQEAIDFALASSRNEPNTYFNVIESPHSSDPLAGRFVVDRESIVRSWERMVGTWVNGERQSDQ